MYYTVPCLDLNHEEFGNEDHYSVEQPQAGRDQSLLGEGRSG